MLAPGEVQRAFALHLREPGPTRALMVPG